MLLTTGYAASGSSLPGFLLTAHPNIVIADEPRVSREIDTDSQIEVNDITYPDVNILYEADDLNEVFNYILEIDCQRLQNKKRIKFEDGDRADRYVVVPNQYQGCFKKLEVIGVKRSDKNTEFLLNNNLLLNLKNKLEKRKIALKFILTTRNPYDMVSSSARHQHYKIEQIIQEHTDLCDKNMKILEQVDPKDIFIYRHEDMLQ